MSGACFAAGAGSVVAGGGGGGGGSGLTGNVTSAYIASSDNAPTLTVPSGGASGDVYVLAVKHNSTHTITWPSGFTEVTTATEATNTVSILRVATRAYTGSEPGSFAATTSGYSPWYAACAVVKGTTSLQTSSGNGEYPGYGSSSTLNGASVTTGGTNKFVFWVAATSSGGAVAATATLTPPSSFTQRLLLDTAGNGHTIAFCDRVEPSSTTTTYSGSMAFTAADSHASKVVTLVFN